MSVFAVQDHQMNLELQQVFSPLKTSAFSMQKLKKLLKEKTSEKS